MHDGTMCELLVVQYNVLLLNTFHYRPSNGDLGIEEMSST